jgi:VIT1/CCC1 family predicted Fe2+/Mn2+ transporter
MWPLFMNKSGLSGNMSSICFSSAALLGMLPFAFYSNGLSIPTANWTVVILAGICGTIGMLLFNGVLATTTVKDIGTLFVLMTVSQVVVAVSYQSFMSGHLPIDKIVGYIAATTAVYLLLR